MAETEQGQAGAPPPAPGGGVSKDSKTFGMLCHLGGLAGYIFPFGNIIAPLIFWLIKKNEDKFVDDQGKESLNFQITISIAAVIGAVLTIMVVTACVGVPLLIAVGICNLIFCIMGAVKANNGELYRYPVNLRLIK
jgi:uncharacterized Tic20 family protein